MLSDGALSELPLSTALDESVPADALAALVSDSTRDLVYLVEMDLFQRIGVAEVGDVAALSELPLSALQPAAESATGIVTFRFCDRKFVSQDDDTPANTVYLPRLNQPLYYSRSLPTGDGLVQFSGIATASGEIRLANLDGQLDTMVTNFAVDGRRVVVKVGDRGAALADFQIIFDGTAEGWESDEAEIVIRLRSPLLPLRLPALSDRFGGTGGVDGGANLKGKGKPLCYGECANVDCSAFLVDPTAKTYRPHGGGTVQDITAVYERGATLVLTTDYTLNLANGAFTLVASPAGLITCDIRGDKSSGTYVTTAADIAKRFLIDRADIAASSLDLGTFDQAAADQPAPVNWVIQDDSESRADALIRLLAPLGLFLSDNRAGKVTIARFGSDLALDTVDIGARDLLVPPERRAGPVDPPARTVRVAFERIWTVQTQDIAGSVTDARVAELAVADRVTDPLDTGAGSAHVLAGEPPYVPALFNDEADADDEAERLADLYGVDRNIYVLRTPRALWRLRLGQTIRLTYPRWDLRGGKVGWVVSLKEDAARNEVEIELLV